MARGSDSQRDMRAFLGDALVAIGILILIFCGGCTLLATGFLALIYAPGALRGDLNGLGGMAAIVAVTGVLPTAIGVGVLMFGRRLSRQP